MFVTAASTSVKLFMAYPDTLMVDDGAICRVMRQLGDDGGLVCFHAENGAVIQTLVEEALATGHTGRAITPRPVRA